MGGLAPQGRSRRSEILAAARREFAAAGYAGGRIERIAAAAAVNKQLLFHYFHSKDGLFRSALEELLTGCEPPAAPGPDQPAEEIRRVVSALQLAVQALPGLLGIIADSSANADFPRDAADAVRVWRDQLLGRLERAVADGQRRGFFRDDIDPAGVAAVAFAAALGVGALGEAVSSAPVGALVVDYCAWR